MPRHKTKLISIQTLISSHFRPPNKNQISRSLHGNQVKFDLPHWNQVNFDHPRKNEVKFDAYTTTKWFLARIQKTKSLATTHTKPSQSIDMFKTTHFPPVNADSRTKNKSISIYTWKPSQFRSLHWNQVKFRFRPPMQKRSQVRCLQQTKWFSASIQKPIQLRLPTRKASQSIYMLETSHFRPAQKKSQPRFPNLNQVNFDPYMNPKRWSVRTQQSPFRPPAPKRRFRYTHKNQVNAVWNPF